MYAREVAGRTLTFGVSGMLLKDGLIMFDRETDTLWTHVDGRAIRGRLEGRRLEAIPAVHATWREWKALYPDSRILRKPGSHGSPYASYNRSPSELGIFGRRNEDTRLPGKTRILGVRHDEAAMAFPLDGVRAAGVAEAEVGGLPVVLAAPSPALPVLAYDRRVDGRVLSFLAAPNGTPALRDRETGSLWRLGDGEAVEGPLTGSRLARVAAHPAFWFGWRGYFPRSAVWSP